MNSDHAATPVNRFTQQIQPSGVDPVRHEAAADIVAVIWRYLWVVIVPIGLGALFGYLIFLRTPESFQSYTRLLVESDRPPILDTITGDLVGGVPGVDIIRSQMLSDRVISDAYQNATMQPFHSLIGDSENAFSATAQGSLRLEPELAGTRPGQALILRLSFQNSNPELCEASVESFSAALQQFFNDRHKSSRSELIKLITLAMDQVHPKMLELEEKYRDFRRDAPLAWNSDGEAINPHRERQMFLINKRSELFEQLRRKSILLAAVESIADQSKDQEVALRVIGQLLDVSVGPSTEPGIERNLRDGDQKLAQLELDRQLVPLMIERNKYAAEFGDSHPTVKQLDTELTMMKKELKRLVQEQSARILELIEESRVEGVDSMANAKEAINAVLLASHAEESLLKNHLEELDKQIENEKQAAVSLALAEQDNDSMLREIERTRELMDQLEEQMARVNLTEEEGGIRVVELTRTTGAFKTGPNLSKSLGIWSCLGLAVGVGLALLLEKNANTFRDPDEVTAMLGLPILTHLPFFKGRVRKEKKGAPNPFAKLDPHLAVVHMPASVPAEAIRSCRTSIFFELAGINSGKIIQVTSPLPGDGKSTIAGNLACSIAQSGKRTLLIDCDLRRPQITDNFGSSDKLGLTNVLNGDCEHIEAIQDTPLATLKLMPSGPIPANPAEALTLPEMSELLDLLRDEFDYIVVDTPPLLVVTDPSILASMVDGVVMALKIRRKSKPNAKEAAGILRTVGSRVLGVVINNSDESASSDGYKGYGYYRYGTETNRYYRRQGANRSTTEQQRMPILVSGRGSMPRPAQVQSDKSTNNGSQTELPASIKSYSSDADL